MARPRSFDETTVLDAALGSFWGRGYEATSIRDLTAAMGISGPSLYNAFGDKRALFAAALDHYCRTKTHPMLLRIESKHAGSAAISAFFAEIIERSIADRERRGCFLINSALEVAPHDKLIAKVVGAHLDAVRAFFARALSGSRISGKAPRSTDVDSAADHLLAVLLGVRVLARTRPERDLLEGIVATGLKMLSADGVTARRHRGVKKRASQRPVGGR